MNEWVKGFFGAAEAEKAQRDAKRRGRKAALNYGVTSGQVPTVTARKEAGDLAGQDDLSPGARDLFERIKARLGPDYDDLAGLSVGTKAGADRGRLVDDLLAQSEGRRSELREQARAEAEERRRLQAKPWYQALDESRQRY